MALGRDVHFRWTSTIPARAGKPRAVSTTHCVDIGIDADGGRLSTHSSCDAGSLIGADVAGRGFARMVANADVGCSCVSLRRQIRAGRPIARLDSWPWCESARMASDPGAAPRAGDARSAAGRTALIRGLRVIRVRIRQPRFANPRRPGRGAVRSVGQPRSAVSASSASAYSRCNSASTKSASPRPPAPIGVPVQ